MYPGLVASSLIGSVYFSPVALSIKKVRRGKSRLVLLVFIIAAASIAVSFSTEIGNPKAMMISTASFVIAAAVISATLVAKTGYLIIAKIRARL